MTHTELKDLDLDVKRYPPRAMAAAIGKAKDHVLSASEFAGAAGNLNTGHNYPWTFEEAKAHADELRDLLEYLKTL